ncbi:MAG: zinc-dependent metalloprotease [Sphingobacteriales bacterium]|nr:zinc-dependent metalloprotease [Sphingobacteriales bacterium]MBI3717126.1 zinc-dependent metalloprotease [Sphingobacteriales bacterium]
MRKLLTRQAAGLLLILLSFLTQSISAQTKPVTPPPTNGTGTAPVTNGGGSTKPGPKPYKEVITEKAQSRFGLLTVHKVEDKWYFEIGDSLLGRDFLVVNRISKAPVDMQSGFIGYAGDEIGENVIRFERGPNNKIFIRTISYSVYAKDSTKPMYKSVMRSSVQPISAAFDIKAFSKDSTGSVIDFTDYMNGDNDVLFFEGFFKPFLRIGSLQSDKSYILDVKSYPMNTEIKTVKTYSKSSGPAVPGTFFIPPSGNTTFELNSSIILLPKSLMRPRYYDDRVAYFTTEFTDFDADPQGVKDISLITRWRLEIKPEDSAKFRRGELVEPIKPIVYYIDPTTPQKWVPYLIQGVNDWQKAFEKAGFKNAIIAKVAPTKEEDSTWSLEDARYSAIVYKPSTVANASGPHVHDPRTGEIIESHINWYHNVMRLLRDWYLIQTAPSDPRARKAQFDDELMGQLIRFVSSHEVGHTLGLPHNMGASASVPVEKLRDKAWVEANGHTPSIMDYARFNYVAQPEDKIGPMGLYPRIGDYDLWSIEWGYKPVLDKTEAEEKAVLNEWTKEKVKNPRLRFLHYDGVDPRAQTECLGDNNMKANEYGLKNLKWIVPQLPDWLNEKGENFENLAEVYNEVVGQYNRYMFHAATYIGGIYTDYKTTEQPGNVYTVVPKSLQKEALNFLSKNLFDTPYWLLNKNILDKITTPQMDRINSIQDNLMGSLLSTTRLGRMTSEYNRDNTNAYRIDEYVDDLKKSVWSELVTKKPTDAYRRFVQKSFAERLISLINPSNSSGTGGFSIVISFGPTVDNKKTDIISVAKGTLRSLLAEIRAAIPTTTDKLTRYHLQDVADRIDKTLNPK